MASGVKLVLEFEDSNGENIVFTFPYAKSNATTSNVKALMNSIITNGDIFNHVPVKAKSAKTMTTSENIFNLE